MTCTVVTLEDRLEQAVELVRNIKTVMMGIFCTIYLTNTPPPTIVVLADFFYCSDGGLMNFSLEKLRCGARVALSFIKAHHPNIDVDAITEGVPLYAQGNLVSIEDQVPAVEKAAEQIIEHLELDPKAEEEDQPAQL